MNPRTIDSECSSNDITEGLNRTGINQGEQAEILQIYEAHNSDTENDDVDEFYQNDESRSQPS